MSGPQKLKLKNLTNLKVILKKNFYDKTEEEIEHKNLKKNKGLKATKESEKKDKKINSRYINISNKRIEL